MSVDPPTPGIDERIAERRRAVRRDRQLHRRRRTVWGAVAVAVLAVLAGIEASPLVGLETVEVVGTDRLDEVDVRDAADLALGTSTLRLRLGRVEERVAQLPLVREASARRLDPLSVRIEVRERVPVLRVEPAEGEAVLLDRDGVAVAPADGSVDVPDALVPVEVPGAPPALGEVSGVEEPVGAAVTVWRGLTGPLRTELAAIAVDGEGELRLSLRSGVEVRFGPADRIPERARALGAVLEDLDGTVVERIDVTAPNRPAVTP